MKVLRFAVLTFALAVPATLIAQSPKPEAQSPTKAQSRASKAQSPKPKADAWPSHTPDGQPDIQGLWFNEATGMIGTAIEPMGNLRKYNPATLRGTSTSYTGGFRPKVRPNTALVEP